MTIMLYSSNPVAITYTVTTWLVTYWGHFISFWCVHDMFSVFGSMELNKTGFYLINYSYRWVVVIPICTILSIVLIKFCMGLVMLLLIYFNQYFAHSRTPTKGSIKSFIFSTICKSNQSFQLAPCYACPPSRAHKNLCMGSEILGPWHNFCRLTHWVGPTTKSKLCHLVLFA